MASKTRRAEQTGAQPGEVNGKTRASARANASASKALTGATPAYVSALFDEYADKFDSALDRLGYEAPKILARALEAALDDVEKGPARVGSFVLASLGMVFCGALAAIPEFSKDDK